MLSMWWPRRARARRQSADRTVRKQVKPSLLRLENRWVPASLTVGTPVNVSKLPGNQSEATVAVNPTDPNNIIALSNTSSGTGIPMYRSTDGGNTWTVSTIAAGPLAGNPCCDPQAVFDKFGNLFIVILDFTPRSAQLLTSSDKGATLTKAATLAVAAADQPSLGVGGGATAGSGSVWVSVRGSTGMSAFGAPVTGLGSIGTFSTPVVLPGSAGGNFGGTAVGPNGEVIVTYQNPSNFTAPAGLFTHVDPDGLGPQPFTAARLVRNVNVAGFSAIPAQPNRTIDSEVNVAYDRSGGARDGRLYMVYTDKPTPAAGDSNTDIFVISSDDDGTTWSTPVKVNDDTGTNSQFFSGIAVDQANGNVAVGFYDSRNSASNTTAEYFVSASIDGGATWLPNAKVSTGLSNGLQSNIGDPNEFGDYYTIDIHNNTIWTVYADNTTTTPGNPGPGQALDIVVAPVTVVGGGGGGPPQAPLVNPVLAAAGPGALPLVRVFDPQTGGARFEFPAYDLRFRGGVRIARADFNADGIPDIITVPGPGGGPHVRIFNGTNGFPLIHPLGNFMAYDPAFRGGLFVATGDVNGDGTMDIITGPDVGGGPHVKIFDGATGGLIRQFMAYDPNFRGGVTVAAGDLDRDLKADVITGAGVGGGPHVQAFGGAGGAHIRSFLAYDPKFRGGIFVAAGDVNGDKVADIITGAGAGGGSHIKAFNGVNGSSLGNLFYEEFNPGSTQYVGNSNYNGGVRVAAMDLDADGLVEVVTATGPGGRPQARVFDIPTKTERTRFQAFDPNYLGGFFVG